MDNEILRRLTEECCNGREGKIVDKVTSSM
jgi:hypothetical protein